MNATIKRALFSVVLISLSLQVLRANISLPEIFSSNMVLQQQADVTIWGWAKAGEKVTVKAGWLDTELNLQPIPRAYGKLCYRTPACRRTL